MNVSQAMKHSNKLGAGAAKRKKLPPNKRGEAVMKEYHRGTLHSGSGKIVTKPSQARAIARSESGKPMTKRKR